MPSTIIDEYKIFPRTMMLMITVLTCQAVQGYVQSTNAAEYRQGQLVDLVV